MFEPPRLACTIGMNAWVVGHTGSRFQLLASTAHTALTKETKKQQRCGPFQDLTGHHGIMRAYPSKNERFEHSKSWNQLTY